MADSTLGFNLLAKDNASKTFKKVGDSADDAGRKFGFLAARSHGLTAGMTAGFGKIVAGLGVIAGVSAFKGFIDEARESGKVSRITENAIKATGGAAKVTADQVGALAERLSNKTAVDDEVIQSGANLLLTFKNVRNELGKGNAVFDRATAAAVDLSAAGFGDVNNASKMLGKALNDPLKGISALGRAGVTFTQQQKDQIKTLVESGNVLGAQKIILKEVETQVGGAAAAAADPMQRLGVIVGNLKERLGTALLPVIGRGADILGKVLPAALDKASMGVSALGAAFQGEGVTSNGFVGVMERIGVAARKTFDFFKTSVIPTAKGFGEVLAPLAQEIGTTLVGAFTTILPKVLELATAIGSKVGPALRSFTGFLRDNGTLVRTVAVGIGAIVGAVYVYRTALGVVSIATKAFAAVQAALNVVMSLNPIGIVVLAIVGLVAALVYAYKHSEKFRNIVNSVGNALKGGFLAAVNGVKGAFGTVVKAGSAVVDFFKNLGSTVVNTVKDAGRWLVNKGKDIVNGMVNGITSAADAFLSWYRRAPVSWVVTPWLRAGVWLVDHGKALILGFTKGIVAILRAIGSAAGWLYKNVIRPFAVTPWTQAGSWLFARGKAIFTGLLQGVVSALRAVAGAGAWVYKNVIRPFVVTPWVSAGRWLWSKGSAILYGLINGVVSALRAIKGAGVWMYNNVIKPIGNAFANASKWLVAGGKNLIYGLFAGVIDRMKNIGTWVKANIVDPVVTHVKRFFGIKSPSKVFESIGRFMIAGLLKGLATGNGAAIAKKVFGSMPKALRSLVGKGLVGIGQLPGKALEALQSVGGLLGPGDVTIPANLLKRTFYQGEVLDFATLKAMQRAESMIGGAFNVMQGSYSNSVAASGGTHSGGGALDLDKDGTTWGRAVAALRAAGFAAWHRSPNQGPWGHHIHAVQIGNPNLSPQARAQVRSYLSGGDGLAGYRQGTPWVPNDQIAVLHRGEAVVPESVNRNRVSLGGGRPIVIDASRSTGFDRMAATWLLNLIRTNPAIAGQLRVLLGTGR